MTICLYVNANIWNFNVRRTTLMSSAFWKSVLVSPVVLGITLLLSNGVIAAPKSNGIANAVTATGTANDLILNKASGTKPVTVAASEAAPAIQPATDNSEVANEIVKPGDWSYTALQGVASKYGCNANLNNQPVSQLEFARSLNTCLVAVEPMLAQQPNSVTIADLEVIKRLTQEFRAQLTEIDGRISGTDKRIVQAQANQFSTTTKLKGEAIFNLTSTLSGANSNNAILGDRVRLLFETSFNGKDRLWTRLATGNQGSITGNLKNGATPEGSQVVEFGVNNAVSVDWLAYQFPVNNTNVYIPAFNGGHSDYAPTYGSNFDDFTGGNGALSTFAEASPIYKIGAGAGIATNLPISETGLKSISVGYLASNANSNGASKGLFNGDYAFLGQLNFKLSDKLDAGLTYVNSYHTAGNPLYGFGISPALAGSSQANFNASTMTANSYGAAFVYKASDTLAFNGFVLNTSANKATIGKQDIWSYGAGLSLPNVDGKGSLMGLLVGAEPYDGAAGSTPYHIEGFYKYKFSDNLSVTPGLIYLTAPNQTTGNGALIGVVRTTFTF
jgi:Carbohydrate-selective porin, OprB family